MLQNLGTEEPRLSAQIAVDCRWNRKEEDDLKTAIEYLYEFKRKLDKLHPNCIHLIQSMLKEPGRF